MYLRAIPTPMPRTTRSSSAATARQLRRCTTSCAARLDRKSTRLNSSHTEIYTLSLHDALPIYVLACNTDAHAKNYAIIIRGNGASIAPMYDLMCGEVWENVTKNLAQKIAGKSRGEHLNGRDWQQFARECGLNPRQVLDRVGTLAKSALAEAEAAASEVAAMPAGTHEVLDQTREAVERRARILLVQLQELGDDPVKAVNKEETAVAKEECSNLR